MADNELDNDFLVTPEGRLYLHGFNEGFLLASVIPEARKALGNFKGDNPRLEGIRDGILEFEKEKIMEPLLSPDWLKRDQTRIEQRGREKDIGMDKE